MLNKELLMAVSGGLPPTLVVRAVRGTSGWLLYTLTTGETRRVESTSDIDVYHEVLISEIDLNVPIYLKWFGNNTIVTTVNTSYDSPTKSSTLNASPPNIAIAPEPNSDSVFIQDPTKDAFITFELA